MKASEFKKQFLPLFQDKEWPCYVTRTLNHKYIVEGLPLEFIADERMPDGYMLYFNYLDNTLELMRLNE